MRTGTSTAIGAALVGGLGLLIAGTDASASGFALPEASAAGIGLSNALVANPVEPGAFAYNPAAMGFHDRSSLSLGGLVIGPSFSVRTESGKHDSQSPDWLGAPMIHGALVLDGHWRLGLGVNAPFGLETRWQEGAFPALSGTTTVLVPLPGVGPVPLPGVPKGAHPTVSKLSVVGLAPMVAYKVNDNLSIAAGANYYDARHAKLDTQLTELKGDGDGWGWNLSFLYANGPWSLGAAYHSAASIEVDGTFSSKFPLPASLGASVDLDLPWRFQLGVRYEITPQLAVEIDWTRFGWSEFDKLVIKSNAIGSVLTTSTNDLDDASAYRIGISYALLPTTRLRLGYSYDQTGQGDEFFTARIADNDRHLFSIGIGQDVGQGWSLDAGYMYVKFNERSFRGNRQYLPGYGLLAGTEINGTDALDGNYDTSAHLLGVELRKTF
jgi:long-chain fatty acid transport protein